MAARRRRAAADDSQLLLDFLFGGDPTTQRALSEAAGTDRGAGNEPLRAQAMSTGGRICRPGSPRSWTRIRSSPSSGSIPAATGYPPHHPDIYRQLCSEFGHDPRTGERLASRQWQALKFPTSGTHGPSHPPHQASVRPGGRRRAGAHALPW
jgi:hypothetical protein